MLKAIPKEYLTSSTGTLKLLWEDEWRALGITQVWLIGIRELDNNNKGA
jgi:cyclin-dependent kinase regulatory subunit CKS1